MSSSKAEEVEDYRPEQSLAGPSILQIVKNDRVDGRPRQSVVATLGRAEELAQNGTLEDRLIAAGHDSEWADIVQDLERLCETEIEQDGKVYLLRNPAPGCAGPVPRTLGVALPPLVRNAQPPPAPPLRKPQKRRRKPRRRSANAALVPSNILI